VVSANGVLPSLAACNLSGPYGRGRRVDHRAGPRGLAEDDKGPRERIADAAKKIGGKRPFKVAVAAQGPLGDAGEQQTLGEFFAIDRAHKRHNSVVTIEGGGFPPPGSARFEDRLIAGAYYLDVSGIPPALGAPTLPPGKKWVKFDASKAGTALSGQLVQGLPNLYLLLRGATSAVQEVGPDEIRGAATTRYLVTVDPAKVKRQVHAQLAPVQWDALNRLVSGQPFSADVWLDAKGRLRKLRLPAGTSESENGLTYEVYDIGVPLDVAPPPASETIEAAE
jgi:hypothetical protein